MKDLLADTINTTTNYVDIDHALFNFHKFHEDRDNDVVSYRDGSFASIYDGTVSIKPKIPWSQRRADVYSREDFLAL
jgi:hypothetical protein